MLQWLRATRRANHPGEPWTSAQDDCAPWMAAAAPWTLCLDGRHAGSDGWSTARKSTSELCLQQFTPHTVPYILLQAACSWSWPSRVPPHSQQVWTCAPMPCLTKPAESPPHRPHKRLIAAESVTCSRAESAVCAKYISMPHFCPTCAMYTCDNVCVHSLLVHLHAVRRMN